MSFVPSLHDSQGIAREHGSPFYLYDLDVIKERAVELGVTLPDRFDLAFAVKANPSLSVLTHVARLGLGADVASGGELAAALRAGIQPDRIVMTGPGKRDDELSAAVAARIGAITVESPGELERLECIAAAGEVRVPVLLRAALRGDGPVERVRLVGDAGAGKFGMDHDDLIAAAHHAVASAHLEPLGIHAFGASNVTDADVLVEHIRTTVTLGRQISTAAGFALRSVDVGGGLGIPYGPEDQALDLRSFGAALARFHAAWADDPVLAETRILLEPGRFLVGPAGVYVATVVDRKRVAGREVAILDGGIHHLLRPALTTQTHRAVLLADDPEDRSGPVPVTLVGPLCSGLDVLANEVLLPDLRVGDLVAILDTGAYGFTESMPFFLSHPIPAEVVTHAGRTSLARPRLEPSTWLDWQIVPGDVAYRPRERRSGRADPASGPVREHPARALQHPPWPDDHGRTVRTRPRPA